MIIKMLSCALIVLASCINPGNGPCAGNRVIAEPSGNDNETVIKPPEIDNGTVIKPPEIDNETVTKPPEIDNETVIKPPGNSNETVIKPPEIDNETVIKTQTFYSHKLSPNKLKLPLEQGGRHVSNFLVAYLECNRLLDGLKEEMNRIFPEELTTAFIDRMSNHIFDRFKILFNRSVNALKRRIVKEIDSSIDDAEKSLEAYVSSMASQIIEEFHKGDSGKACSATKCLHDHDESGDSHFNESTVGCHFSESDIICIHDFCSRHASASRSGHASASSSGHASAQAERSNAACTIPEVSHDACVLHELQEDVENHKNEIKNAFSAAKNSIRKKISTIDGTFINTFWILQFDMSSSITHRLKKELEGLLQSAKFRASQHVDGELGMFLEAFEDKCEKLCALVEKFSSAFVEHFIEASKSDS